MKKFLNCVLLSSSITFVACGDDKSKSSSMTWGPCEQEATERVPGLPTAECGQLEVPLRNSDPTGPTITVGARRYLNDGVSKGRVWYLEGGPGGTGLSMESDEMVTRLLADGWDFYISVHRGLEGATPLECDTETEAGSPFGAVIDGEEIETCADKLFAEWGMSSMLLMLMNKLTI